MLGEERLRVYGTSFGRDVGCVATRNGERSIQVMLYNFEAKPEELQGSAKVNLTVENLPFKADEVIVEHYRIDGEHSNAYTEWIRQGRPEHPSPEQASAIRNRESLELYEPIKTQRIKDGRFKKEITLPPLSVTLIKLKPKG